MGQPTKSSGKESSGKESSGKESSGKQSEAADEEPRNAIEAFVIEPGLTVIQPGPYGRTATILKHASVSAKSKDLAATLAAAREAHDPATKVRTDHVRNA
ncbi:MAG: hypothetical protein ACI8Q9_001546, partial [Planctomycetota bacterium]